MSQLGEDIHGISLTDHLESRVHQVFTSSRGSVRLLVLNDGGRELAVDMNVIYGSRLRLHESASECQISEIEQLLQQDVTIIEALDKGNRTAVLEP